MFISPKINKVSIYLFSLQEDGTTIKSLAAWRANELHRVI